MSFLGDPVKANIAYSEKSEGKWGRHRISVKTNGLAERVAVCV
jgi:hypothetical protein